MRGMSWAFDPIAEFARNVAPMALVFGVLALVLKRQAIVSALGKCRKEALTNVLLAVTNAVIIGPLFAVPFLALEAGLSAISPIDPTIWSGVPAIVTLALCILLTDLPAYWRHRLQHRAELWRFHATHHSDTALHWLTLQRKHPVEKVMSMMIDLTLVMALQLPIWAILLSAAIRSWWGHFLHCDVPWTLGPLGKVLMSPAAHRMHHIRDEALMGHNYANTVTLWDRLFGTWADPTPHLNCETGIAEGTRGFLSELVRPFEAAEPQATEAPAEKRLA